MDVWSEKQFKEIWVNLEDEQAMCALINGEYGWLMYLREGGDSGFTSRNPAYKGTNDATMEFTLSNGQVDEYPLSEVLPIAIGYPALTFFEETHKLPDFVTWQES